MHTKIPIVIISLLFLVSSTAGFNFEDPSGAVSELGDKAQNFAENNSLDEQLKNTTSDLQKKAEESNFTEIQEAIDPEKLQNNAEEMEVDPKTRKEIKQNIRLASQKLPKNEEEREELTVETAREICRESPTLDEIGSVMDDTDSVQRQAKRMEQTADLLNDNLKTDISSSAFNDLYTQTRDLTKYAPLIGSYQNLINKSCAVEKGNETSIKEFYFATTYFGAEVALIQAGVTYKTSSKAVRYMNSKAGMARIRGYCGDDCYSFALSEAHWLVRGAQNNMKNQILYDSEKFDMPLEEKQVSNLVDKNYGNKVTGQFSKDTGLFSWLFSLFSF